MPAKSQQQQKFMGLVHAFKKGEVPASKVSQAVKDAAKSMTKKSVKKYAKTKHDDLPKKVSEKVNPEIKKIYQLLIKYGNSAKDATAMIKKNLKYVNKTYRNSTPRGKAVALVGLSSLGEVAKRDYKAEYKKFQSSPKMKKYRAELNKYNRKKGTYGNGDGKDASHKGGKIVGFESQSKNRGRAEKSRLKKEAKLNENPAAIAAAQRMVVQKKQGGKVSVNTARQPSYAKKDPLAHKKAKSMWQRIKDKFSKKEGVNEAPMDEAMKNWNDVPKKGTIDFGKYGKYVILSKNRLRVSGKFVSGTNKGKKVIWYSRDGQKDYRKRKGLSLADTPSFPFNQVKESVKEADLGLTYKKGKTVKVKHKKSGKTIVIVDKPVVRKEYEKIGYFAESVNENVKDLEKVVKELENASKMHLAQSKRIQAHIDDMNVKEVKPIKLKSKSGMGTISHVGMPKTSKSVEKIFKIADSGYGKMAGTMVDSMSANLFKQVYDKANDDIKKKLNKMNEKQLINVLHKMWNKFGKNVKFK